MALEVEHQHDLVVPLAPAHEPGAERREAGLAPAIVILSETDSTQIEKASLFYSSPSVWFPITNIASEFQAHSVPSPRSFAQV